VFAPTGATKFKVYVGFAASTAGERCYFDDTDTRRVSVITGPVYRSGPVGQPRIDILPGNYLRLELVPSEDPLDVPGWVEAKPGHLTIATPTNAFQFPGQSRIILRGDRVDRVRGDGTTRLPAYQSVLESGWSVGADGVLEVRYDLTHPVVKVHYLIRFGAAATYGPGLIAMRLPFPRRTGVGSTRGGGVVTLYDLSSGRYWSGTGTVGRTTGDLDWFTFHHDQGFNGVVTKTLPFVFAAGDEIYGTVEYEIT
jgi:hypothetical protein